MAPLPPQDVHLRTHLDRRRRRLQLPHPGKLPHRREVASGGALQNPRLLDEVGRRASLGPVAKVFWYWALTRTSSSAVSIQSDTMRSVSRTSRGVGFSPAISALMASSLA